MKDNRIERMWAKFERESGMDEQTAYIREGLRLAFAAGALLALREAEAHGDEFDVPVEWIQKFAAEADEMMRKEATA